jgi:outer membrane lipoprotein-sorting protein
MFRRWLAGLALLAALTPTASAQTVDELIAKNIQAKGGMEKLKSVRSVRMTGKTLMGGVEVPIVMIARRPTDNRVEFTFQGMTGVRAYDGKHGWMLMPFMGKKEPEELPAEVTQQFAEQADFDGPLVDYKEKGNTVELVGKEQVEGAEAYKLKVTLKSGNVSTIYLDADSHLEIAREGKFTMRGAETEVSTSMGDYKEVEGMMVAHSMSSGMKGTTQREQMTFEKIEFNVDAPDSLFAMPANAKPAAVPAAPAATDAAASPADSAKAVSTKKAGVKKAAEKSGAKKP